MNATNNLQSKGTGANPFVPMTETQMDLIKGGTIWPSWLVELIGDAVDNLQDALDHLGGTIESPPADHDDDFWDTVHTELQNEGFIIPDM